MIPNTLSIQELEKEGSPISVTLIKPSTIDTPYIQHAKNLTETEPLNPPPVYSPDTVAHAIRRCAEQPEREVFVGAGIALSELAHHAPQPTDKLLEATMFDLQRSSEPKNQTRSDSLYAAGEDRRERGHYPGHVSESSVVAGMSLHPIITGIVLAGISLALGGY